MVQTSPQQTNQSNVCCAMSLSSEEKKSNRCLQHTLELASRSFEFLCDVVLIVDYSKLCIFGGIVSQHLVCWHALSPSLHLSLALSSYYKYREAINDHGSTFILISTRFQIKKKPNTMRRILLKAMRIHFFSGNMRVFKWGIGQP